MLSNKSSYSLFYNNELVINPALITLSVFFCNNNYKKNNTELFNNIMKCKKL